MINHVAYEVDGKMMAQEVAFWEAIGWAEVFIRSRSAPLSRWLRTPVGEDPIFVHLLPGSGEESLVAIHICVIPPERFGSFDGAMRRLDELEFAIEVEEVSAWWNARRMFLTSPAGLVVELLEHAPPAGRPLPPVED